MGPRKATWGLIGSSAVAAVAAIAFVLGYPAVFVVPVAGIVLLLSRLDFTVAPERLPRASHIAAQSEPSASQVVRAARNAVLNAIFVALAFLFGGPAAAVQMLGLVVVLTVLFELMDYARRRLEAK